MNLAMRDIGIEQQKLQDMNAIIQQTIMKDTDSEEMEEE